MGRRIVNIALLGAGEMGRYHADTIGRLRDAQLVAVVDPVAANARQAATYSDNPLVADAALKNRLPAIGLTLLFARDGLLIAYGPVQIDMYRRAATLIARILDGSRPADLPIERPVHFALLINLKTAKTLGLTIPQSLLVRADEVIQ